MQHIYFIGIGGAGLSALANCAKEAGYEISGSDQEESRNTQILKRAKIRVLIEPGIKEIEKYFQSHPIDWVVASSSIPKNHPEIAFAKAHGLKVTKRDALINELIDKKHLKLLAVSGTHGKTTTTGMLIWLFKQFDIPLSYVIGTNLSFGDSGRYESGSEYFVLEADEFDKHMLAYKPFCAVLPSVEYDHPDTYPNVDSYKEAFREFASNSHCVFLWEETARYLQSSSSNLHTYDLANMKSMGITLPGEKNRQNAFLAVSLFANLFSSISEQEIVNAINGFPGTQRRMEKLAKNLYTDYAHHPSEISATIQLAKELCPNVVVVYQPHQNIRQHTIQDEYGDCFKDAKKVYWLPTYLSREDPSLKVLLPNDLIAKLTNPQIAETADMNNELIDKINSHRENGELVLVMGAGSVDPWIREILTEKA